MTLTLPRRAVVDPDELPATVSAPPASPTATDSPSGQWSDPEREWLRKLNWGLFETLVESAFSRDGFAVEPVPARLDGRADMLLQRRGEQLLVQCKYWKAWQIGTSAVAELRELVDEAGLDNGLLITAGTFSPEAAELAEDSGLLLLDGDDLLRMAAGGPVLPLADETTSQWALPKGWTAFGAPTCPLCEAPMLYKRVRAGEHTGMRFWGCRHYPTCRAIREVGPAYAGLPLERPAPHGDADAAVVDAVGSAQDPAVGEEAAPVEDGVASQDVVEAAEPAPAPEAEGAVIEPTPMAQMLPAAPVPAVAVAAALPVAPLPVEPLPAMPLPVVSLPVVPMPAASVMESAPIEAVEEAAQVEAAPVEAVPVGQVAALPVAPPPSVAPIISEPIAAAPAVVLPSAPVSQPTPVWVAPAVAAPLPTVPAVGEVAPTTDVPATPVAAVPSAPVVPAVPVPSGQTVPPVAAPIPPAPVEPAPVPSAPVAPVVAEEAPLPVVSTLPMPSPSRPDDAAPAPASEADPQPATPEVVEPELVDQTLAEPEVIVRRRAELGLPELQLPPGAEDSYTVLLAHPTWSDPRDEDDVPGFVPEEHAPYQWPTSADLLDEDRAVISWPESAPEPAAEAVPDVAVGSPSRRRHYLMIGGVLAVAAVLTIAVAVLIPAVMSAMKLIMH